MSLDPRFANTHWDYIIVGTGIGGATLGYSLAQAGKQVLFCEKGLSTLELAKMHVGDYAETYFEHPSVAVPAQRDVLRRAGRFADAVRDVSGDNPRDFVPFIGSGTGGSSALYGMAMERFLPADFSPREHHPDALNSNLQASWPFGYDALEKYYMQAETLYGVRGEADPLGHGSSALKPSPELSPSGHELFEFLAHKGLNPYRLPMACRYLERCEGCQGFLCGRNCKNDSVQACLRPAIEEYGAELLDDCEVMHLESRGGRVTGVVCRARGADVVLKGSVVVLAAGALVSPALLLRSANASWPNGLGNGSGLVGKNLMRHLIDLYAVFPKDKPRPGTFTKELAFNDFYLSDAGKFGTVQSFGTMPPGSMLVEHISDDLRAERGQWTAAAFAWGKPIVRRVLDRVFPRTVIFAGVMEDMPYLTNEVRIEPTRNTEGVFPTITLKYQIGDYDRARLEVFRGLIGRALKPYRFLRLLQAENNQRIAHACGTCRAGTDPDSSVLDANNKAHELENLYIVDASFFPSSGGTNPALTIAANALRVADHMLANDVA